LRGEEGRLFVHGLDFSHSKLDFTFSHPSNTAIIHKRQASQRITQRAAVAQIGKDGIKTTKRDAFPPNATGHIKCSHLLFLTASGNALEQSKS
jgi:predicted Zn-dependent protease